MQGITGKASAHEALSQGPHSALPPKPRPAGRQALQSVNINSTNRMPNSLPQSGSFPFPGITKSIQSSSDFEQMPSYLQQSHESSMVSNSAILAQHAFGGVHASNGYASSCASASGSVHPPTSTLYHQKGSNNMNRDQGFSHQANNRAGSNSPFSAATGTENLLLGLGPKLVDQTHPQSGPDATATAAKSGKADNAYVSFDEWQAQVRAKQSQKNRTAMLRSPSEPQPFSWLPGAVLPGSASPAMDSQSGTGDFEVSWYGMITRQ